MKVHVLSFIVMLGCTAVLAQESGKPASAAPVEVSAEPSHHLKIENEYIRAYYVEVLPQQSTLMHHHSTDYIGVAFGSSQVDVAAPDGTVKHVTFQDGQVSYAPAGVVHAVTDQGSAPFRNATVELLQNQGHPVCVKSCENDPRAKDWPALFETEKAIGYGDTFRILAVSVKPQQTVSMADASPHLVMVLSDVQARITAPGQAPDNASHRAGEIVFHGPHPENMSFTNTGAQEMRLVEVQFKPVKP